MRWRNAQLADAVGVSRLLARPDIMRLTTTGPLSGADAAAMAIRSCLLADALVLDDDGVRGWLGAIPGDGCSEVAGVMDVARYGVMPSVTIAREGLRTLNPTIRGVPVALVNPRNLFALRCLDRMGILIGNPNTWNAATRRTAWRTVLHP